jgi:nucleotide-binding universal stress UspA family protein
VAFDSEAARAAVSVASSLADLLARRLVLLHVAEQRGGVTVGAAAAATPGEFEKGTSRDAPEHFLDRLMDKLELPASDSERRVEAGEPSLLRVAEAEAAELIVVGTRGAHYPRRRFSAASRQLQVSGARCPVLVVPPQGRLESGPLVCAVDDSPAASEAVRVARRLSEGLGRDLVLAHVVARAPIPSTSAVQGGQAELARSERQRAAELLAGLAFEHGFGTDVERRVAFGSEAEAIAQLAGEEDAALVVIGTRRRGALRAAPAGSISLELVSASPVPVLVVPTEARLPLRT